MFYFYFTDKIPGANEDNEQFANGTLQTINGARGRYNAEPLEINEQLSEIAQRWAEQMARSGKLEHSPTEWRTFHGQILGENYAASFQSELTGKQNQIFLVFRQIFSRFQLNEWLRNG